MKLKIDSFSSSLNKAGEEVCGNIIEIAKDETGLTAIFSDGEGDGTGASITSSFVTRMAAFLLKNGEGVNSVIRTIADTYSETGDGGNLVPGITVVRVTAEGNVSLASMNMPKPIVLKRGKPVDIDLQKTKNGSKQVYFSDFSAKNGTMIILFNEGFLLAGKKNVGWDETIIKKYLQISYKPVNFNVQKITKLLITAAGSLELNSPNHDISVLSLQTISQR